MTKRKSKKPMKNEELGKLSGGGRGASARRPSPPPPTSTPVEPPSGGREAGGSGGYSDGGGVERVRERNIPPISRPAPRKGPSFRK